MMTKFVSTEPPLGQSTTILLSSPFHHLFDDSEYRFDGIVLELHDCSFLLARTNAVPIAEVNILAKGSVVDFAGLVLTNVAEDVHSSVLMDETILSGQQIWISV